MSWPVKSRWWLLLLLSTSGCTTPQWGAASPEPATPPPPDAALAQASNAFALDLFHQMAARPDENYFVSPYSLADALALAWTGARGSTAMQMAKALHFNGWTVDATAEQFGGLNRGLNALQSDDGMQLLSANSLWPEQNPEVPLKPAFLARAQSAFDAAIFPQDFKNNPLQAATNINAWVEQKTHGKIQNLVHPDDVSANLRLALVNAVYFKGAWLNAFHQLSTSAKPFYLANGTSKNVPMMETTFSSWMVDYRRVNDADSGVALQLLALPYRTQPKGNDYNQTDLAMVIVMPCDNTGLDKIEKSLTAQKLSGWLARLSPPESEVNVWLPKFTLQARYPQLPTTLAALGIQDAFDPTKADFNDIADYSQAPEPTRLYLAKVIQQTFISVDEKGTEAAAASYMGMAAGAAMNYTPPPVIDFHADHPFLFLIRQKSTGLILFMGRLADPSLAPPSDN